jgi:hypothetical protein
MLHAVIISSEQVWRVIGEDIAVSNGDFQNACKNLVEDYFSGMYNSTM